MDKPTARTLALTTGAIAGASVLVYTASELARSKRFKEPGWTLPGLGHLYKFDFRNLPWELERLRSYVRDKVMGVWVGPDYWVYVTSPELTHKVFVEHGDKSSGRSVVIPQKELPLALKGIALNEGPLWKKNRQLILRELVGSKERIPVVSTIFDDLVVKIGAAADQSGGPVPEVGDLIHKAVASGLCMMIFGMRLPDKQVDEILEHVDYIGKKAFDYMMLVRIPFYKLFSFETVLKFESACKRLLSMVDEIVKIRMAAAEKTTGMKSIVNEPYLNEVLMEAIQGGLDTTTAMIEWCLAYLANDPKLQRRIHDEMDEVCGPDGPSVEDERKLVLLQATIMETLRMGQISSLIIPHKATESIDIGNGYKQIPKGATVLWSFNELHGDEKIWGDPWVFRPDRFIDDFPGLTPNPNQGVTSTGEYKKFMPFGIGPRHCPGYKLATYELYIALSRVLWQYEFSSVTKVDLSHYTHSIPVRVKGFVPTVKRRKCTTAQA